VVSIPCVELLRSRTASYREFGGGRRGVNAWWWKLPAPSAAQVTAASTVRPSRFDRSVPRPLAVCLEKFGFNAWPTWSPRLKAL